MQSAEEIDAAVNVLKASLENRIEKQITGAVFGELVRSTTPKLDIKALDLPAKATFSRFIEKYFDGVLFRSHSKGSDWVYTIGTPPPEAAEEPDYALWRAFVRSHSKANVGLVEASKTLTLVDAETSPLGVHVIPSVTQDELSGIVSGFVEVEQAGWGTTLPDPSQPYASWTADLREGDRTAYRRWVQFRIDQLLRLFSSRLESAELDENDRKNLTSFMDRSRSARPPKVSAKAAKKMTDSQDKTLFFQNSTENDSDLRDLVIRAVMALSASELRELRLPVGAVADALGIHRKK